MLRPDRSDEHLSPGEEARREEEAREYFDGIAPKRHGKPQRSDYSSSYGDRIPPDSIPELHKFRDLESRPEKLVCSGTEPDAEYVETEYYKDLNGIDKQHHRTGTGFIKVERSDGEYCFNPAPESSCCHPSSKGNPATNEWIPSPQTVIPTSDKPNRSDV